MLDKHLQIDRHYFKVINSKPIHIKILGDLHHSNSFSEKKLNKIEKVIDESPTDYLCIVGDLIDSTNYLYDKNEKNTILIEWLRKLGTKYKVFLTLGNHDFTYFDRHTGIKDIPKEFLNELRNIPGLTLSHNEPYYEDDLILIYQLELDFDYYKDYEKLDILLATLMDQKEKMTNLNQKKVKILLIHSPSLITHPKVLEYIKEFDYIIAGHMHNGLVHPFVSKIIPKNRGIISPNKKLFPLHARGVETIEIDNKKITLIVTGGIVKIQECASPLNLLNYFFPMQMDEIVIDSVQKLLYKHK